MSPQVQDAQATTALLCADRRHRITNGQTTALSGGGVSVTGFSYVSGAALCEYATLHDKHITVTTNLGTLTVVVSDITATEHPKFALGDARTTVVGSATTTSVHAMSEKAVHISALRSHMQTHCVVEVLFRPSSISVITVVGTSVKGGLSECVRNGLHNRKSTGFNNIRRSRTFKIRR
tara:strand:- start:9595 stop:10128 length:534 start_codon:yes stop_codon:yes gene_type:complete